MESTISRPDQRERLRQTLLSWSIKGTNVIALYAQLAHLPLDDVACVLGSCFARIYDDILDASPKDDFPARVSAMLEGEPLEARTELEKLAERLFRALESRLDRPRSDAIYQLVRQLHLSQIKSLEQRGGGLTTGEILAVTERKGALSLAVLFALTRKEMPEDEQALVMSLGAILQLVDDYQDVAHDRRQGIVTPATLNEVRLRDLLWRTCDLLPSYICYYGAERAGRFLSVFAAYLLIASVGHSLPSSGTRVRSESPLGVLIARGPVVYVEPPTPGHPERAVFTEVGESPRPGSNAQQTAAR